MRMRNCCIRRSLRLEFANTQNSYPLSLSFFLCLLSLFLFLFLPVFFPFRSVFNPRRIYWHLRYSSPSSCVHSLVRILRFSRFAIVTFIYTHADVLCGGTRGLTLVALRTRIDATRCGAGRLVGRPL